MDEEGLRAASRIKNRAIKLERKLYPAETNELCGDMLLCAIKYVIFDHVFGISSTFEYKKFTNAQTVQLAHWLHLRKVFGKFTVRWTHIVETIKARVKSDLTRRLEADHPLLKVFGFVTQMHEMHIRKPKQSLANVTTCREDATPTCYNVITNAECEWDRESYSSIIFNPLPSDANYELRDPEEESDQTSRITIDAHKVLGWLESEYDVPEQFCFAVTPNWGKLLRLLHNICHLVDYINVDVLHVVYTHRMTEVFEKNGRPPKKGETPIELMKRTKETMDKATYTELISEYDEECATLWKDLPWNDVWRKLTGDAYFDAPITRFKKKKGVVQLASSVHQIADIVKGAIKLYEKLK